jgi:hypothetical protein
VEPDQVADDHDDHQRECDGWTHGCDSYGDRYEKKCAQQQIETAMCSLPSECTPERDAVSEIVAHTVMAGWLE